MKEPINNIKLRSIFTSGKCVKIIPETQSAKLKDPSQALEQKQMKNFLNHPSAIKPTIVRIQKIKNV